jgi:DNA adenine methylase
MKSPIRWSGSKRLLASEIIKYFPKEINTYYEPFVGGGSVFCTLIDSGVKVNKIVCSDINNDLISLWNMIINDPDKVINCYASLYEELYKDDNGERQKTFFREIRNDFNKNKIIEYFMFLTRVQANGLIRYNDSGEFNSPLVPTKKNKGIVPSKLTNIIEIFNSKIRDLDISFKSCSYKNINSNKNDYVYLDPPYSNSDGLYYGTIDYNELWKWMEDITSKYSLSFNGIRGDMFYKYHIPTNLYSKEIMLKNNQNGFRSIRGGINEDLFEGLYIK